MDESVIKSTLYTWLSQTLGQAHVFTITFDANFVLGNTINISFDGENMEEVESTSSHSDTINAVVESIQKTLKIFKAELTGEREITCTAAVAGDSITTIVNVTGGGVVLPSATIADVIPSSSVTVIFADQTATRPDEPYATIRINSTNKNGFDEIRSIDTTTNIATIGGQRQATIQIDYFGSEPIENIMKAYNSLEKRTLIDTFSAAGFAYINKSNIQNLTSMLETKYLERASFDLVIGYADNIEDDLGIIEKVFLTTNVTADGKDLDVDNIQTGPIEIGS